MISYKTFSRENDPLLDLTKNQVEGVSSGSFSERSSD